VGRRGPAPTPTKVLQLRGTFRSDRHGGQEPHATPLKAAPRPPKHIDETARKIWRKLAPALVAAELLTENDLGAFESYCVIYARALDAEAVVAVEGRTVTTQQGLKRHPELVTAEKARADMRKYEQLFGLSPSDRARLRIPTSKPKVAADPWDEVASG
jgi:P27 family predicted phage terminase small subunit